MGTGFVWESGHPDIVNSIIYHNEEGALQGNQPAEITVNFSDLTGGHNGQGNLDIDPLFVDPELNDYTLQSDSPVIDQGDPESPADPDGTRADMGAFPYEHVDQPPVKSKDRDPNGCGRYMCAEQG